MCLHLVVSVLLYLALCMSVFSVKSTVADFHVVVVVCYFCLNNPL